MSLDSPWAIENGVAVSIWKRDTSFTILLMTSSADPLLVSLIVCSLVSVMGTLPKEIELGLVTRFGELIWTDPL